MAERVVLAFSGGLDTSFCVPWLSEEHGYEVVTCTVDVGGLGQRAETELREKALALGAVRHVHIDARAEFFDSVLRWLIAGNAKRGQLYPLCVGAERGLQARMVAETARELSAAAVAHGCTAAGNDQVRFEIALRATAPELSILAPIRDGAPAREEQLRWLDQRGQAPAPGSKDYSINSGLWGVTIGGRETLGSEEGLPESAWLRTKGAFDQPKPPLAVRIGFECGIPSHLDGIAMSPVRLIEALDLLAAEYGIGRGIHLGDTVLGLKGRVAFEAPAATVLLEAHRELEKLVLSAEQARIKDGLGQRYGELVHAGAHAEPACRDIEALLASAQARVTGEVRLTLRAGSSFVEGVRSPFSLMAAARSTYGESAADWTPADAAGFCRLTAVQGELHARAAGGDMGRQSAAGPKASEAEGS